MKNDMLKRLVDGGAGTLDDTPALEALLSRITQAMYSIKEAEERFRYSIDRLGADASGEKPVSQQSPVAGTFLSRLHEAAEFAENMRDDLHEQANRLNRLV